MSEKELKNQRKYVTDLINSQLKIFKLNGKTNQEVTFSLPKVTNVNKTLVKKLLEELLGYTPEITFCQEIKLMNSSVLLITLVLQKK